MFPVEIALSPVSATGGTFTVAVIRDISLRRSSEAEIRRVRHALDAIRDGAYLFDTDSYRFSHVNEGAVVQTGYSRDALLDMTPLHLTPQLDRPTLEELTGPLRAGEREVLELATTLRRRDGGELPVEVLVQHVQPTVDDPPVFVAIVRDISDRVETQQRLLEAERHVARFEDRERIARDLHDRVIQRLFAAGLGLQAVASSVLDVPMRVRVENAVDEVDEAIRDLRTVIFDLRHRAEERTLRHEVLALADEYARTLGFDPAVRFDGPVDTVVAADLWDHVLAALRETLSNVARHARAQAVEIDLVVDGSELRLLVCDDGVGLPADGHIAGDGLRNLAHRAQNLGGAARIAPRADGGTRVEWEVSLRSGTPPYASGT